jgi:hypothetical protein
LISSSSGLVQPGILRLVSVALSKMVTSRKVSATSPALSPSLLLRMLNGRPHTHEQLVAAARAVVGDAAGLRAMSGSRPQYVIRHNTIIDAVAAGAPRLVEWLCSNVGSHTLLPVRVQRLILNDLPYAAAAVFEQPQQVRVQMLQALTSCGDVFDQAISGAVAAADTTTLRWVFSSQPERAARAVEQLQLYSKAAEGGHVAVLDWLQEHHPEGAASGTVGQMYSRAAADGHVVVLDWLLQHHPEGAALPTVVGQMYSRAAGEGHVAVQDWLQQHHPEGAASAAWEMCNRAAADGHVAVLDWQQQHHPAGAASAAWAMYSRAAGGGHIAVLDWIEEHNPVLQDQWHMVGEPAVALGQVSVLEWLRARQLPELSDATVTAAAAAYGRVSVLEWLRARQLPELWDATVTAAAAAHGKTFALEWLQDQMQMPELWDSSVTLAAARAGQLSALRWLRSMEPPCPWSWAECLSAARRYTGDIPSFTRPAANARSLSYRPKKHIGNILGWLERQGAREGLAESGGESEYE